MSETSRTFDQMNFWGTASGTCSPEPAAGHMLCDLPDGPTPDLLSPSVAHVSLTPQQAKEKGSLTSGTFGRQLSTSSTPWAEEFQSYLASRLAPLSNTAGGILWRLIWKESVTPAKRKISRLVASARSTKDKGSTSSATWPTPQSFDATNDGEPRALRYKGNAPSEAGHSSPIDKPGSYRGDLKDYAGLAGWPTPKTPTGGAESAERKQELGRTSSGGGDLQAAAILATWPTPDYSIAQDGESLETWEKRRAELKEKGVNGNGCGTPLTIAAQMAGWPTPAEQNADGGPNPTFDPANHCTLQTAAQMSDLVAEAAPEPQMELAGWPTPTSLTPAQNGNSEAGNSDSLRRMQWLATWSSPTAQDHSRGNLPPREWDTGVPLTQQAAMTNWPTPQTADGERGSDTMMRGNLTMKGAANLTSWATPRSEDSECPGAHRGKADGLHSQANLSNWSTPSSRDWKDSPGMAQDSFDKSGKFRNRIDQLARQAHTTAATPGPTSSGFPAGTENIAPFKGQLNPALSRFLMGLPPIWDWCALRVKLARKSGSTRHSSKKAKTESGDSEGTAMPSSRSRRKSSSGRISTPKGATNE